MDLLAFPARMLATCPFRRASIAVLRVHRCHLVAFRASGAVEEPRAAAAAAAARRLTVAGASAVPLSRVHGAVVRVEPTAQCADERRPEARREDLVRIEREREDTISKPGRTRVPGRGESHSLRYDTNKTPNPTRNMTSQASDEGMPTSKPTLSKRNVCAAARGTKGQKKNLLALCVTPQWTRFLFTQGSRQQRTKTEKVFARDGRRR